MLGSGFLEFKLDYAQTCHLGIGDVMSIVTKFLGRQGLGTGSRYVVRYLREFFTLRVENEPDEPGSGSTNPGRGSNVVNPFYVTMVMSSENFSAGGYLWRINCYPRGVEIDGDNEHLSIYLQLVTKSKNVKAVFDASVVGRDGTLYSKGAIWSVEVYSPKDGIETGWKRLVKRSDLESSYVTNGTVTILCGVIVVPDIDNTLPVLPQPNLANHLGHLLDSALGTDVSFVVGGEVFPAHRAVLAARSPVFSAELFGPMVDATMPSITLHDIEPAAFRVMLQFMYTDALPADDELGDPLVEMMIHLLAAADRYVLDRLKVVCELKLCENVSAETVASVLACAETYGCLKLKTKCMDLFAVKRNFKKAVVTDGFIMLLQKFPTLAGKLATRVAL